MHIKLEQLSDFPQYHVVQSSTILSSNGKTAILILISFYIRCFIYYLRNTAALFKERKRSAAPDSINIFFFTNHNNIEQIYQLIFQFQFTDSKYNSNIMEIQPTEILTIVFSQISSMEDLFKCYKTCSRWQKIIEGMIKTVMGFGRYYADFFAFTFSTFHIN